MKPLLKQWEPRQNMNEGWIKISRAITDHWVWQDAERLKWWLYLLLNAQWEDTKVVCGNQLVELKRGQLMQSVRNLAETWGVGKQKAFNFIELLKKDGMISIQLIGHQWTVITICNYESYQAVQDTNEDNNKDTNEDSNKTALKNKEKNQKKKENIKEIKERENSTLSSSREEKSALQKKIFCGSADSFLIKGMSVWDDFYYVKKGLVYSWPVKDRKSMKELLEKIRGQYKREVSEDEILKSLKIFLDNIRDTWTQDRLTVAIVNMKFDELMQQMVAKVKRKKKEEGIGYVDFRPR